MRETKTTARVISQFLAAALLLTCLTKCTSIKTNMPETKIQFILDMHCHVAGIGAGNSGCYVSPALKSNWRYSVFLKAFGVTQKELEKYGDGLTVKRLSEKIAASEYVDAAVVLALDGAVDQDGNIDYGRTELYIPNAFIATETAKYDNLFFGASINPYRPDSLKRLEEAKQNGAVLVKWLPSIQHIDPADEKLIPFYKKLVELKLPLLTHTGHERSFTNARQELADPKRLQLPLDMGVTVIAAHAGATGKNQGEKNFDRLLAMFEQYPNLYADISSLTQLNKLGYLSKLLKRKEIHARLMYGTDMPIISTLAASPWYFPFDLSIPTMFKLSRIDNPWDQDVLLKKGLGVPNDVFTRSYDLLIGE